MKHIIF